MTRNDLIDGRFKIGFRNLFRHFMKKAFNNCETIFDKRY